MFDQRVRGDEHEHFVPESRSLFRRHPTLEGERSADPGTATRNIFRYEERGGKKRRRSNVWVLAGTCR